MRALGFALCVLFLAACASEAGEDAAAKDYGADWPFTVSEGTLRCDGPGWVTFESAGVTYAINGLASGHADQEGWVDSDQIWASDDEDLGLGLKKNMGPIIDDGLALCDSGEGSMEVSGVPGTISAEPEEPSEEEQQEAGFRTFSDFNPKQQDAYLSAYAECLIEVEAGNFTPDLDGVRAAAESLSPGTGEAAWEGCADAVSGTPISGSGIERRSSSQAAGRAAGSQIASSTTTSCNHSRAHRPPTTSPAASCKQGSSSCLPGSTRGFGRASAARSRFSLGSSSS